MSPAMKALIAAPPTPHSITAYPDPDESLIGYMFRLAKLRHLRNARSTMTGCGFRQFTNQPERSWLEALSADARIPVADLEAISFGPPDRSFGVFRGMALPGSLFDRRGGSQRRVCPECLAEKPFHRAIWDLRFVAACPFHLKFLMDTCQACRKPLRWQGNDPARCTCLRGDLTRMQAEPLTEAEIRGTKAIYGLLGHEAFRDEAGHVRSLIPFRDMTDAAIVDFLCRIGMTLISGGELNFTLARSGEYLWQFHEALTRGLELAEEWPDAFFEILDRATRWTGKYRYAPTAGLFTAIGRWLDEFPRGQGVVMREVLLEYRHRPNDGPVHFETRRSLPRKPRDGTLNETPSTHLGPNRRRPVRPK
jgi:hypothetical protein